MSFMGSSSSGRKCGRKHFQRNWRRDAQGGAYAQSRGCERCAPFSHRHLWMRRELLRGCATFDEMMFNLQEDPKFAAAVLRCVTSANAPKLVDAVNALPRLPG